MANKRVDRAHVVRSARKGEAPLRLTRDVEH